MALSIEQFLNNLSRQILNEEISLFLGAGISNSAGYPTWANLLKECAADMGISTSPNTNLYLLAQYYSNEVGYNELKKIVNNNINCFRQNSTLVDTLLKFNFKTIWTTNYDTVIEKNLEERKILSNSIYDDKDLVNVSQENRVNIYKLNGDINNLEKIVITQKDLEAYVENHKMLLTFFKKDLVSKTFLFLGYSFKDSLALSCLSEINQCLGESSNYHYAIIPRDGDDPLFDNFITDLEKRYHVRTLIVDSYDEVPYVLNQLINRVQKRKIFISGAFDSITATEENFAMELCENLVYKILENHYRIISGMGYRLGNFIGGYGLEYLSQCNKVYDIERYILMRPMPVNTTEEERVIYRTELIQQANASIFLFGQSQKCNEQHYSEGVWAEYQLSKKMHKKIIPIGITGYESRIIWQDIKEHITQYPYLENYMELLNTEACSNKLCDIVLEILNNISKTII